VPARVLAEGDVPVHQCGFDRRKLRGTEVFLAQESVDRSGAHSSQEHAFGVNPATLHRLRTTTDEHRPRGTQGDKFVRIHGEIVGSEGSGVFQEITGHPMVFSG